MTALLLWTAFFLGRGIIGLVIATFFSRSSLIMNFWFLIIVFGIPLLMLAGLLSRLGLAIPELMRAPSISIGQAFRASLKKTEDWEGFFMLFLTKSAILGSSMYGLADHALAWLWQNTRLVETGYSWLLWTTFVCITAMLESPLFIAFSVLCRDWKVQPVTALVAPAMH